MVGWRLKGLKNIERKLGPGVSLSTASASLDNAGATRSSCEESRQEEVLYLLNGSRSVFFLGLEGI